MSDDLISRQAAINAIGKVADELYENIKKGATFPQRQWFDGMAHAQSILEKLPPAQPEKEIPKRVLWSGWKGCRDTRYKCQTCNKPVRNDDVYCHRCGQKLIFPKISHTPYVPGEKQELIVRWDDE